MSRLIATNVEIPGGFWHVVEILGFVDEDFTCEVFNFWSILNFGKVWNFAEVLFAEVLFAEVLFAEILFAEVLFPEVLFPEVLFAEAI